MSNVQLISLPTIGNPDNPATEAVKPPTGKWDGRLRRRYNPYGRPAPVVAPGPVAPPVLPPISSIGIMDVGIANCNMLIDQNNEPILYYDLGYPLWFYLSTLPNTMRAGNAAYLGPIAQNQAGTLEVVLSHWDWDHWRLGRVAGLNNIRWTYPNQNIGPSGTNFINSLAVANRNRFAAPFQVLPNYTIYQCTVPPGTPAAMIQNNTGLALSVFINLPTADLTWNAVLLTADANVMYTGAAAGILPLTGILAVHHGSNANGATANLPAQAANYNNAGRIFFSYGVNSNNGNHPYGFPVPAAIVAWQNAGWTLAISTAEGANMNANPPNLAGRGNIRVAANVALNAFYNGTAFVNFPNLIN
ncbi:hypothetical protein EG028_00355 [Chitinophaga barathri]|uniref:Uncharacterized protein n=2 Tax=Chitinophaga barathri TaxID=1647451 RepID=A0A3N4MH81_9BACT|nr:hypothetical protein EG028_00355 [Chitinophaga barathri]